MKIMRDNRVLPWISVVVWMGLIFFLSAQPKLPDLTRGRFEMQDVAGHFLVYAVLALLLAWALRTWRVRRFWLWALVIAILYGVSDEGHQYFVPNRHPDVFDLLTDAAGAGVALLLAATVPRLLLLRRSPARRPPARG